MSDGDLCILLDSYLHILGDILGDVLGDVLCEVFGDVPSEIWRLKSRLMGSLAQG